MVGIKTVGLFYRKIDICCNNNNNVQNEVTYACVVQKENECVEYPSRNKNNLKGFFIPTREHLLYSLWKNNM